MRAQELLFRPQMNRETRIGELARVFSKRCCARNKHLLCHVEHRTRVARDETGMTFSSFAAFDDSKQGIRRSLILLGLEIYVIGSESE